MRQTGALTQKLSPCCFVAVLCLVFDCCGLASHISAALGYGALLGGDMCEDCKE